MAIGADEIKAELIESVARRVRSRMEPERAAAPERFVRRFYERVAAEDMVTNSSDNLFGAALALWRFGEERAPRTSKVRVYNPTVDEDGWHSSHTIVEIVTDDMPFLVDSVTAYLNRHQAEVHLIIHPLVHVARDDAGALEDLFEKGNGSPRLVRESFMHVQVSEQPPEEHERLRVGVERVLADVRAAVEDWGAMCERCREVVADLDARPGAEEAVAFLEWLRDENFTFLGYREYRFEGDRARVLPDSGLGVLRDELAQVFDGMITGGRLPVELQLERNRFVRVTKANRRSTVHRRVHMDTIGVKRFDGNGQVIGENLFIGLFTAQAYSQSPGDIPLLRRKVDAVLARAATPEDSHDRKTLLHILDTYPRDDLYQISEDDLFRIARGILHLQERQRVALFARLDPFGRFASCLVYTPRDRYDTALRLRFQAILEAAYEGEVTAFYTRVTDAPHARLHFIVKTTPGAVPDVDHDLLEERLVEAGRSWEDRLRAALLEARGEQAGMRAFRRFGTGFPVAYRDHFNEAVAVRDVEHVERAVATGDVEMNLYRRIEAERHEVRLKLYTCGRPQALSDILPMLENMGFKVLGETPYRLRPADLVDEVWIHDFELVVADRRRIDLAGLRDRFGEALGLVWRKELENDGFNRLVLAAGLDAREVTVLRAYCKFLRQARIPFSQRYMERTLARHPELTCRIVRLFQARFAPAEAREGEGEETIRQSIESGLDEVADLDDDRILRAFLAVVDATLRTNYQLKRGYLSFKLDSRALESLPRPRPLREIFVYSPRMEAVHLRGGLVARGGIRWSDRREDFRTEVLGLMKAQMVKNAVIVPVGSKGGFVVKRRPREREALREAVLDGYRTMMRGLLDLTDNLDGDTVVAPAGVVRRDGDDPYLVVAADKGTATFSDVANAISAEYGFWLDDAFASGGSAGYDHKKMGITARGAWESVKRHFREAGKDIQSEDFTVVGIGDMAGDVFGNGMLLSRHIRLVAAFNHMHVFVDPEPDADASYQERTRIFELKGSTWDDYDRQVLSPGGGIWSRQRKSIPVSPEMAQLLGLEERPVTPDELVRAILKARVELLWLGGIGTYVRASNESDAEVGDRSNDSVRVTAREVRATVVGEGANLGLTQRARIEYALGGGRINTDAIDNSAGVDCSDHEVNIKILLGEAERAGELTRRQRDELLVQMTDEVAALVLRDNYLQTQSLTVTDSLGARLLDRLARFMRRLERDGRLDRRLEFLPDDEELNERFKRGEGMTRPELCVLLSYAKLGLYERLLDSGLPDDPAFADDLAGYFPAPLRARFAHRIARHRLRRELVATVVTNEIVNRVGITFVHEVREKTGHPGDDVARAYLVSREVFGLAGVWAEIEALDNRAPASMQARLLAECGRLVERATVWFLRHGGTPLDIRGCVDEHANAVRDLAGALGDLLAPDQARALQARAVELTEQGVPPELAERVARLAFLAPACDVSRLARQSNGKLHRVARTYFEVGARFGFNWLRASAARLPSDTAWNKLAIAALVEDLDAQQAELAGRVLDLGEEEDAIEAWAETRRPFVTRAEHLLTELQSMANLDLAMLAVAARQLKAMAAT